jgi:ATP-dependent Lon protease
MRLVIAPADNAADVEEIPKALLKNVKFEFVETIDEVLALALEPPAGAKKPKKSPNGRANVKKPVKKTARAGK